MVLSTDVETINVALVHFPSLLHRSEDDNTLMAAELSKRLEDQEQKTRHSRTMLVGDLNLNPFSKAVVSAAGLHATMSQRLLAKGGRKVDGAHRKMFYNPMWRFLGDGGESPPGTYFHRSSSPSALFWHAFDQVLLRASLVQRLIDVKIVTRVAAHDLSTQLGRPNKAKYSDHFPIVVRLSRPKLERVHVHFADS
ncbi:MAG: hypothetical protein C0478_08680 [Planctomyces sp.]|nr:hypothetical protein [Planctomyces sp.]